MTTFTWQSEKLAGAEHSYKITWYKDGAELCSGTVALTGTEEGIAQALIFAAMDIRAQHPDLFVVDVDPEEKTMEDIEDVQQ